MQTFDARPGFVGPFSFIIAFDVRSRSSFPNTHIVDGGVAAADRLLHALMHCQPLAEQCRQRCIQRIASANQGIVHSVPRAAAAHLLQVSA